MATKTFIFAGYSLHDKKQYGVTEVSKGRVKMMWLDRLTHPDAAGNAHWEVKDVLFLPAMRKNQTAFLR